MYDVRGNQERYLLAERFTDASYPIPFSYRVRGPLDRGRLQTAISHVVSRHDVMRASFRSGRDGFVATVKSSAMVELQTIDLDKGEREKEIRKCVAEYFNAPVSKLEPEHFVKAQLIRLTPHEHIFTFSLHHAIGDAISVDIVVDEIFRFYAGEQLPPVPHSYYDAMESEPAAAEPADVEFWREKLAGIDEVAALPSDLDDEKAHSGELEIELPFETVTTLASSCDATPFEAALAVTNAILARFSNSEDVLVTFQSSGRKLIPSSAGVVGPFSNSVVLRTKVDPTQSVASLIASIRSNVRVAIQHERHPYHLVVRETGVQPNFGCNWFPQGKIQHYGDLIVSDREFLFYDSNYDLNIRFVRSHDRLRLLLHYDASKISKGRIAYVAQSLVDAFAIASENPLADIGTIWPSPRPLEPVRKPEESHERIFDEWLRIASESPDRIALISGDDRYTYEELERATARLGSKLIEAGLRKGDRVGILARRGAQHVINMLAVLRIGAVMVPFDLEYPAERLGVMARIVEPKAFVAPPDVRRAEWMPSDSVILRSDEAPITILPGTDPRLRAGDTHEPAYMLFTSGTTGVPKCIATSHAPVVNFLRWQRETFGFGPDDCFTNLCGIAHDMMIRDVFAPLSVGGRLAIPNQETIFNPGALLEWCKDRQATISHLTPAMGKLLSMARRDEALLSLRLIFFGGDRLEPTLIDLVSSLAPRAEIVNFYGTTETPQAAAFSRCEVNEVWRSHPIGVGIDNFDLRVLDQYGKPVPDGVEGEIVVRSPYLSLGYVVDGNIVQHRDPDEYATGDVGMVVPSGEIMFIGRRDDQVSIRGYRIELDEISRAVRDYPKVREAVVLIDGAAQDRLVAFVAGDNIDQDAVYAWLTEKLPHYMIPGDIVPVPSLPLLPNGKLDRAALFALPRPSRSRRDLRPAETLEERELVRAWEDLLGIEGISPEQSFAELHGDSLAYVQVFLATEELVGELPDDWQVLPLEKLVQNSGREVGFFKWIDTALFIRAIAIVIVVSLHLHFFGIGGGATSALLIVSGYLIGKLQMREMERSFTIRPLLMLAWRVFLPSIIYALAFYIIKVVAGKPVSLSIPLMYSDLLDYRDPAKVLSEGYAVFFWYIAAFLHIMLAAAVFSKLLMIFLGRGRFTAYRAAVCLFLIGLPLKFLLPGLLDPSIFRTGIPVMSVYSFAPTSHFSTLMLGACIAFAHSNREKMTWSFVMLAYCLGTWFWVPSNSFLTMVVAGGMLIYLPRIPIPRWIHLPILYLSGASLFIYLTHSQVAGFVVMGGFSKGSAFLVPISIAAGIIFWMIWQKLSPVARKISPL